MSEFGTVHAQDDSILTAAQWNAGLRRFSRELQNLIKHWLYDGTSPGDGNGGVAGGLAVAAVSGQMKIEVSPGFAFYFDSSLSDPLSTFGLVMLHTATQANVTSNTSGSTRVDVVSIESPTGTDNTETVTVYDASPESRATQRGAQPAITVTAGTPGAGAPSTPTGHLKLAEISIPTGTTTNLSGATFTDSRVYSRGPVNRDSTPIKWHLDGAGVDSILQVDVGGSFVSAFGWDQDEDWPVFDRQNSTSGDSVDEHYPMLIDGARTWWLEGGFQAYGLRYASGDSGDLSVYLSANVDHLVIEEISNDTCQIQLAVPIPTQTRGLEFVGAEVDLELDTAFDNFVAGTVAIRAVNNAGSYVTLATAALSNTPAGLVTEDFSGGTVTPAKLTEHALFAFVTVSISGSDPAAGELHLHKWRIQFKEGRA